MEAVGGPEPDFVSGDNQAIVLVGGSGGGTGGHGGGGGGGVFDSCIEVFDSPTESWLCVDHSQPELAFGYHGSVAMETSIYIFGGFDGNTYYSDTWRYCLDTDSWDSLHSMLRCRSVPNHDVIYKNTPTIYSTTPTIWKPMPLSTKLRLYLKKLRIYLQNHAYYPQNHAFIYKTTPTI